MKKKISKQTAAKLLHLPEIVVISVIGTALCLFSGTDNPLAILLLFHFGFCESALIGLYTEIREVKQTLNGYSCDESYEQR